VPPLVLVAELLAATLGEGRADTDSKLARRPIDFGRGIGRETRVEQLSEEWALSRSEYERELHVKGIDWMGKAGAGIGRGGGRPVGGGWVYLSRFFDLHDGFLSLPCLFHPSQDKRQCTTSTSYSHEQQGLIPKQQVTAYTPPRHALALPPPHSTTTPIP